MRIVPALPTQRARWVVALVVVAVVVGACGGGTSLDDYFGRLGARSTEFDKASNEISGRYQADLEGQLGDLQASLDLDDPSAVNEFFQQATELAIVKTAELFSDQ